MQQARALESAPQHTLSLVMRQHPLPTPPRPIMETHSMGALLEGSLMDLKQMGPLFWDLELKVTKESS